MKVSIPTSPFDETAYLELVHRVLYEGELHNGRNGLVRTLFGERIVFNLRHGIIPLLTTKRVFWRGIVEELLWFLRGSTDVTELQDRNIHIWDGNSSRAFLDSVGLHNLPEGQIGDGYGKQWRRFGENLDKGMIGKDQLAYVLTELRQEHSRRCVLSAWNPNQLEMVALPPCHIMYQFYKGNQGLSCQMYQRSQDLMSGAPFNIASTSLFTYILAHLLRLKVDRVIIVTGDTHIYEQHVEQAKIQLKRMPKAFPRIRIVKEAPPIETATIEEQIQWIESLVYTDFVLDGYDPFPALKYEMIA